MERRTGYKFDLPPDAEQLEAIEMVAVEWSYLENVIDAAIWTLASIYEEAAAEAVTTHLAFNVRLNMLATLFHLKCDSNEGPFYPTADQIAERRTEFETLRRSLQELSGGRSAVVHARWVRGSHGSPMTYVVQARGRLERTRQGMPEIRQLAGRIAEQSIKLRKSLDVLEDDIPDA